MDLEKMDVEQMEQRLKEIERENEQLEYRIGEIHEKQDKLSEERKEISDAIERRKYHGMTLSEYVSSLAGREFKEGDFKITISDDYKRDIFVETVDDDMHVTVDGGWRYENHGSMRVFRKDTREKKGFNKTYYSHEVPKNRKDLFDKMIEIKAKYSRMILDGEL